MDRESFSQALARSFELPDDTMSCGLDARAEFSARFAAALQRLERSRAASASEIDNLMSALGAARVQQWELALALLDAGHRPPPQARRVPLSPVPLSIGTLRQRFHFVMAMGADRQRAR